MSWAADFLVIGGATDVSLHRLARVARGLGVDTGWIEYSRPGRAITYQPESNALSIDGVALAPKAVFYRMEYFVSGRVRTPAFHERSFASYALIDAWASAAGNVRSFNKRSTLLTALNKPLNLHLARAIGLSIPPTQVTNAMEDCAALLMAGAGIAKPVNGGDYVLEGDEAAALAIWEKGVAAQPAIVQKRLDYPEYRIFVAGDSTCTFEVRSPDLDYRQRPTYQLRHLEEGPPDPAILPRLKALARQVGLGFSASDFKTDPDSDDICFLEINSMPMFAAYDKAANGALARMMVRELGLLEDGKTAMQKEAGEFSPQRPVR